MDQDLLSRDRALAREIATQSESARIDFRRRLDQARAVIHVMPSFWKRIDDARTQLDERRNDNSRYLPPAIVLIGFVAAWFVSNNSPAFANWGLWLVIYGFILFACRSADLTGLDRRFNELLIREKYFLCLWLASGASEQGYWLHRSIAIETEDFASEENERALLMRKNRLWIEIQEELLWRSTGEVKPIAK